MFFDCTGEVTSQSERESCNFSIAGLLAGLVATVITKWRANDKYSYGGSETQ